MTRIAAVLALPLLLITTPLRAETAPALSWPVMPEPLSINAELFNRYWVWLKVETGAPEDLAWPEVTVEPLPSNVRMGFFFPTPARPDERLRIAIAPRTIARANGGERLVVLGELAHEIVHYALLLAENGWETDLRFYYNDVHHHCDPTFKRLVGHVGEVIWQAYHSNDTVRAIDHMVQLSCWRDGHMIGRDAAARP